MQFQNPPIVELVVELKWASVGVDAPAGIPQGMPYPEPPNVAQEKFLSDFLQLAAESGWKRSERLMPLGFPNLHFQPALRIRSDNPTRSRTLIQVGPGVFSVHALKPYKSWEAFWPVAEEGIDLLLRARNETDKLQPFFSANVMYVDVFEESIVGGLSVSRFLRDVLGFGLSLPPAVKEQVTDEDQVDVQFSFKLPLRDELEMRLSVNGNTVWGDKKGILMTTVVSSRRSIPPNLEGISEVFGASHLAIRRTFVGLTERVHQKMNPVGERA
jgi:uncharacterized protein (TIGR04255 family)